MPKKDYTEFKVTYTMTVVAPFDTTLAKVGETTHAKMTNASYELAKENNICVASSETAVDTVANV